MTIAWDFDREALVVSVVPGEAAAGAKAISGPSFTIIDHPISSPAEVMATVDAHMAKRAQELFGAHN